jgi:hypothetical protein
MTPAKELSDQITKAMEGVSAGPWEIDSEKMTDLSSPYDEFVLFNAAGHRMCSTENADYRFSEIHTDGPDEDGFFTDWNEPARKLMNYIALCNPDNMRVILSALADAQLQSTADSRIAELEQQIANIKASRDLQITIAADEEERARKAEAQRETYEEILRVVCGHLELPQSESGPADDLSLYDRALEQADVMYRQTEAERVEHMNARYRAESEVVRLEANIKRLTSNPADHRYWEGRWRDSEAKLAEAVKVIEQPFCVLFLDGRNEHGSHVLPSYPRSFEPVGDDIDDQAEAILVEAERLGFSIGEHVWAEFVAVADQIGEEGRIELSGYWEFKGINAEMSRVANASILSKLEGSSHAKA